MLQVQGLDKPYHLLDTISRTALCDDTIRHGLYVEYFYDDTFMKVYVRQRHGKGKESCRLCRIKFEYRQHWTSCALCEPYKPACHRGEKIWRGSNGTSS